MVTVRVALSSYYFVQVGVGDLANRIITVGPASRLEKIVEHFDAAETVRRITSSRGFTIVTGTFQGTAVSCVSIGIVSSACVNELICLRILVNRDPR
jgi:uridine phosphorylase